MKLSVVVCVKNEALRIKDCLDCIMLNKPEEIIVVDGDSTDETVKIAESFKNINVIKSKNSNLTRDRQIGIDKACNDFVALIDADHRLKKNDLNDLLQDLLKYDFDIVQSGLISFKNHGFWDSAEEQSWELVQNKPGKREMIGTAPAIYKKSVFKYARFDDRITTTIDDTDFSYRLSKFSEVRIGVGDTNIAQYHFSNYKTYIKKFLWYGKGDGEFCIKNPERSLSMIYHLAIRYPIVYSFRALYNKKFKAVIFFIVQGNLRLFGLIKLITLSFFTRFKSAI